MGKVFLFILLLLMCIHPVKLYAQEGSIIKEIIIIGQTRTSEEIIFEQLPFQKGDIWRKELAQWTIKRLETLNIFAYEPLQIITEPLSKEECRVVIRVADPSFLYKDPAEFVFNTGVSLAFQQFSPTLYNPFGDGMNFNLAINWSPNYSYGGSITSPVGSSLFSLGGHYYQSNLHFSNKSYESSGLVLETGITYWWNESLRQTTRLNYHSFYLDEEEYEYIIPRVSFFRTGFGESEITLSTGLSLQDDPFFWQVRGTLFSKKNSLLGLLRGGYTSPEAPFNYTFATGGYHLIPLRGESLWHLTKAYLLGTLEYHLPLNSMLIPILFIDGGLIWKDEALLFEEEMIINLGLGLALDTPLGIPVRFDIATNPVTDDWNYHIGFGHSFRAPF